MDAEITDMDSQQLVAEAVGCVQAQRAAECRLLQIVAAWADAHPADGIMHEHTLLAQAGERSMQYGGDGTPDIAEFAPAELGVEIGLNPYQATALIADAVDLAHRLPRIWKGIRNADVPVWQARRVAARTRTLTAEQAGQVDVAVGDSLGQLSGKRLDHLLEAQILRTDRERVEADTERARRSRHVSIGPSSEQGLKDLYARLDAPDAIWVDGSIDALADIMAAHPDQLPAGVPDRNPQSKPEWRAVAMAVLARPFLAAQIWANHAQPDLFTDPQLLGQLAEKSAGQQPADPGADPEPAGQVRQGSGDHQPNAPGSPPSDYPAAADEPDAATDHDHADQQQAPTDQQQTDTTGQNPSKEPSTAGIHHGAGGAAERARTLQKLIKSIDPTRLVPRTVLHIHISRDALRAEINAEPGRDGIARVEVLGPQLLSTVRGWLGTGCHIKLQPIIDCDQIQPIDRYEIPPAMWESLLTRSPASVFPWSGSMHRRMDADHTSPYQPPPDGPPGQTLPENLGPLNRREHRYKTFGNIQVKQPCPGTFIWRTRHRRVIITNPAGTHDLGTGKFADIIWETVCTKNITTAA
jgi:hypothetical protein